MLVFGDRELVRDPRAAIAELRELLRELRAARGVAGHARLVGAFVDAGELAQGLADAEAAARGRDARGPLGDAAMAALVSLARAIEASWRGEAADPTPALADLERLGAARLPDEILARRAEGYAFYAVYPEAYQLAARRAAAARPGARRRRGPARGV